MPVDVTVRHALTPRAVLGGSSSVTVSTDTLKRAKNSERPKVSSQHKYKGDHVLTRTGKRGALVLGRLAKALAPRVQPGGNGNGPVAPARTRANAMVTPPRVQPPRINPPPVPPRSFVMQLSSFERRLTDMRGDVEALHNQQPDPMATPKERVKAETAMVGAQTKLKGDVDKALGEIGGLLSEKTKALTAAKKAAPPDPGMIVALEREVHQLKEARRGFIAVGVGADFTSLAQVANQPLAKGGVVAGLWSLFNSSDGLERAYITDRMGIKPSEHGAGFGTLEVSRMIDDFNAGRPVKKDDGTALTTAQFMQHIDDLATGIGQLFDTEEGRKTVAELKNLSSQINTRIEFSHAVTHFEAVLDKFSSVYKPPNPPAVDPFKNGFPLSSAMQAISSAFPHSREFGNSGNIRQLEAAATSVAYFAEMISRGEPAPALHGVDLNFDKAVLPLKQAVGGDVAVQKLREDRAKGPLPSDAMIALLDKTDDQLTVRERTELLDLVGNGRLSTLDDAREILHQAKEDIRIARTIGGDPGVQRLRDERNKGPLPSDTMIALLGKTDDQLSVRERAAMLDLVGKGRDSTLAEARDILTKAKQEIDGARQEGRLAVAMRHELTLMDKKLSQLLTVDRRSRLNPATWGTSIKGAWYTPNKWGSGERVTTSLAGVKIDAQFMKGLRNLGGEGAGKDVAILTARFAYLQQQTILKEQHGLGLHEGYDWNGVPSTGKPYPPVDPANPLAHFGITNNDLAEIGLSPSDIRDVGSVVERLSRQGVASLEEVHDVTRSINDVSKIVLKSELIHETILVYEQDMARAQGARLLNDILTDGDMSYRGSHLVQRPRDESHTIATTDTEVSGYFKDRNSQLKRAVGDDGIARMKVESEYYRRLETSVGSMYSDHMAIDTEIETRRAVITTAQENLGITVDPDDPRGLRSAKQILIAVDAQAVIDDVNATPLAKSEATTRRDQALESLRGFDTTTMKQPWHAKAHNALAGLFHRPGGDRPDILTLQNLREVAEAIVYIRETGPMGKVQLEGQMTQLGTVLEGYVASRREANPEAMAHVTTMIRAAVLAQWQNAKTDLNVSGGQVSEGFDPSSTDNRKKIEATLKSWGLDIDAFTPEIDSVLFSRMSPDDMAMWRQETRFSDAMIARMTHDDRPTLNLDRVIGRRVMDTQTRQTMLGMLEAFQEGDKLDLKAGQRITLDTNKIPVEPTGLAGIRARLAAAHIGQFEIEMGSDGFKVHFRTGGEVRGNLDGVVGKKFGESDGLGANIEARLEASVGLEGSTSRLTGMTISFDKGPEGRQALVNLVAKMIDGETVTVRDWQSATDVGYTYENRAKGGVGARGDARIAVGGKPDPNNGTSSKLDDEFIGVGVSAGVSAGVAIGGKWVGTDSLNQVTRKGEVEVSTTMSANVGIYARFWNVMNMGTGQAAIASGGQSGANSLLGTNSEGKPLYNISESTGNYDLLNVGVTHTATAVRKWKLVTAPDGQFTGAERVRQSSGTSGPIPAFAACLDSPQMVALMNSDKPEHQQFVKDLQTFMKLKGPRDHIAVTFSPKPGVIEKANALIARAISARNEGDESLAGRYETAANDIMHDESNYIPTKIGLITTDVQKREDTNINARWIKWDTFSDGKSEHRGVVLSIPPS